LQDLFVDAKVPRAQRAGWPIVATPTQIVWVAGLRAAHGCVAIPASEQIIHIRIKQEA
jgi:hypothetical protein